MTTFNGLNSSAANHVQSFQEHSLLLTTQSLGALGILFIDLTIKPPSGFEPENSRLVIDKHLTHYSFILTK